METNERGNSDYDEIEIEEITNADDSDGKPEEPTNEFEVNLDTEQAAIVENIENPYYTGLNDIDLEDNGINDRIEEADILQQTENPYYTELELMNLDNEVHVKPK